MSLETRSSTSARAVGADSTPEPLDDTALLDAVIAKIEKSGTTPRELLKSFALTYLHRLPWSPGAHPEALYRETSSLFDLIRVRTSPIAVRAFNPTVETHGYDSDGTVVEIHVDDSPFLVDSVTNELGAHRLGVARVLHPVLGAERDEEGELTRLGAARSSSRRESVQHYVLERKLFPADLPALERALMRVLEDVSRAVSDFERMVEVIPRMSELARSGRGRHPDAEIEEVTAFLEWLADDNFVFLGYREYEIVEGPEGRSMRCAPESGLGILSDPSGSTFFEPRPLNSLPPELAARFEDGDVLIISKTNRLSTVHRRARMDYIGIRITGPGGESVGEARLLGLFTSKAYMERASRTPVLRRKLESIAGSEDLIEGSHDHKAVVALFESFPKDELFGVPTEDLRRLIMGLLSVQERARVQLFVRRDLLDRSARVLVAVPRDRYSTELAKRLEDLFLERFEGVSVDFHLELGSSDLARLHYRVWVGDGSVPDIDFERLENDVLALTRSWAERVTEVLARRHGPGPAARMVEGWAHRFPSYYTSSTELGIAAGDIEHLDRMSSGDEGCWVGIQNEVEGGEGLTRIALYGRGRRPLSDLTPALEDMGLQVVEEVPTRISGEGEVFIHDFGVLDSDGHRLDLDRCGPRVASALMAIWHGGAESDSLARLIVSSGLDHVQVDVLRAYRTYWRVVRPSFTVTYVNDTLVEHPEITRILMDLFEMRFDPARDDVGYEATRYEVLALLEAVPSLDQDRILRGFLRLIETTLRTNLYRPDRGSIALKLASAGVPDMPAPRPEVEVFVMGRDVEGIHLRAGPVARGGIRWSDRREDYRTEVLGLMKAQVTKNSVIVPTGAKGGFVLRRSGDGYHDVREAVTRAYETFIRGILDVTDNLVDGEVVHPPFVRVHDGDDPYLVVAADKGTSTFSDTANEIASDYSYWLRDAFASGGSAGYDHKALGITARGAWKSLERHLLEIGIDPHAEGFSVVGIGDMSGDVFGNGMLVSRSVRLVAAFDHRHIFIDPDPDPSVAHAERRRLFEMGRSSWDDYDRDLLSEGGGVYPRTAKEVRISAQAGVALGIDAVTATPAELIRMILRAPVDVLWNGGIGTYVKGEKESDEDVGDRANDQVRVNGSDLRCRVVVEGGNLGLTQAGRIEFARCGGRINTDFIDNSGGVNCSDREVNLKILLDMALERGHLDESEKKTLLSDAAPEVVDRILADNSRQVERISLEEVTSVGRMDSYEELVIRLEEGGLLERALEGLPTSEEMAERSRSGRGLSRPELAVLMAHAKRDLARSLLASDFPESAEASGYLAGYFPTAIAARFGSLMGEHPLKREIISTLASNDIVHAQGSSFVSQLVVRSGATVADVVSAYIVARDMSGAGRRRAAIQDLFGEVDPAAWTGAVNSSDKITSTLTRWFSSHGSRLSSTDLAAWARAFADLEMTAHSLGPPQWQAEREAEARRLRAAGFPSELSRQIAVLPDLVHAPGIIELSWSRGRSVGDVCRVFFRIGQAVQLDSLTRFLAEVTAPDPWNRWARQTLEDDLAELRRTIAEGVLDESGGRAADDAVDLFLAKRSHALKRVVDLARSLQGEHHQDLTSFMVVLRQIEGLATSDRWSRK